MAARRFMVFVGSFALLIGAILSVLQLSQIVGGRKSEQADMTSSPPARVPQPVILVAARPIAAGTLLRLQDVARREATSDERPDELVLGANDADVLGAVVRRDIRTDQPLMPGDIVKPGDRGFLAAVLTPGTRAISIPVGPASSMAGLMAPGDRIDLVLMQNFPENGIPTAHKSVGETVLHDVRVIAIDQTLSTFSQPVSAPQRGTITAPPLPRSIALEVTERQAEKVFVALELGKLELSLRSIDGTPFAPTPKGAGAVESTWAEDVSPALRALRRPDADPFATGVAASPHFRIMRGIRTESECVAPGGSVQPCDGAAPASPAAAAIPARPASPAAVPLISR
jgi:pilus assembly protein CpaB